MSLKVDPIGRETVENVDAGAARVGDRPAPSAGTAQEIVDATAAIEVVAEGVDAFLAFLESERRASASEATGSAPGKPAARERLLVDGLTTMGLE